MVICIFPVNLAYLCKMKNLRFTALILFLSAMAIGAQAQSMDSPEATFKTLRKAIKKADIETYATLWYAETAEREGMVSRLKSDPDIWGELQNVFKGPQKMTNKNFYSSEGQEFFKTKIVAKKAAEGGIGTMSMVKEDGKWLMYRW